MHAGFKLKLSLLGIFCGLLLAGADPALASRAHEFERTFAEPCAAEPCEGAKLKEPSGVAVEEASEEIYVTDRGEAGGAHGRVVRFSKAGAFLGEFTGPNATGTGTLSEGSSTIASAVAVSGAFSIGEEVTATGLPAGTKITALPSPGTLKVSNPVEAGDSGIAVELKAQQRFERPEGIAVDNSCVLRKLSEPACKTEDPSNGDVYVVDPGEEQPKEHRVVDKFTAAGEYLGQIREAGVSFQNQPVRGVAVDPEGAVWVYRQEPAVVDEFSNEEPNKSIAPEITLSRAHGGFAAPGGLAVDSHDNLYGVLGISFPSEVNKWEHNSGNLLIEALDGEGSTGVAVEQISDTPLSDNGTSIGVFSPEGKQIERLGQEHGAKHLTGGAGIGVNASASDLYVADAATGEIVVFGPAKATVPKVEGESLASVGQGSASIGAEINPQSEAGEAPTEYHFQYGRCATPTSCAASGYEAQIPIPDGQIPASFEVQSVSAKLEGLEQNTTYHFRAIAKNGHGEGEAGAEETFTTEGEGGELKLPDNRGWELVSPPDKKGALIEPIAESGVTEAAASGNAITYLANAPTEAQPQGYSNEVQAISRRGAAAWSSRDIAIPHAGATGKAIGEGPEYKFFDQELTQSAVQPFGEFNPALSAEASESTAYLHSLSESCGAACFRPFVTGKPGFANVPEGTAFGEAPCGVKVACGPQFAGASDDLSHVVLSSTAALVPGAAGGALYEWAGGALTPVSVTPGQTIPEEGALGLASQAARGAISSNGARVSWEGKEIPYERDTAFGETVQLDEAEAGCSPPTCESGGGRFQFASANGSRVLFTDEKPLTEDSGAAAGKADLYECQIVSELGKLVCALEDLTPKNGAEAAEVQGGILGASEDATTVYFVAKGVQSQAPNARGEKAKPGQPNVYVRRAGATEFIATLSLEDEHDWSTTLREQPTRVSPSGQYLELMSEASPTGYDNRDRESGRSVAEVYLYDTASKRLACASCDPSGARPVGVEYAKLEPGSGGLVGGGRETWISAALVGANVPGWTQIRSADPAEARYQPRYLNNEGRLFFNSINALVPQDANGTQDVYEYEPPGVGSCSEELSTYSARSGGCVSLISSGSSTQESAFLDASESGNDVYFLTSAKLSPLDTDAARDVYDAHVCTSVEPCITFASTESPPCNNEASCKASPTPQPAIFGAPASATFSGPANTSAPAAPPPTPPPKRETVKQKLAKALKACRAKKNKHKRTLCEKAAHKKYPLEQAKKGKAKKARKAKRGSK